VINPALLRLRMEEDATVPYIFPVSGDPIGWIESATDKFRDLVH